MRDFAVGPRPPPPPPEENASSDDPSPPDDARDLADAEVSARRRPPPPHPRAGEGLRSLRDAPTAGGGGDACEETLSDDLPLALPPPDVGGLLPGPSIAAATAAVSSPPAARAMLATLE